MTGATLILLIFALFAGWVIYWARREERAMQREDAVNIAAVQQEGQWQVFIWSDQNAKAMQDRILEQQAEVPELWLSSQDFVRVMGKIYDSRKERTCIEHKR